MSNNFGWAPASKTGIIPLRPLAFGEVLGRTFSALRHNPRVLLGFAITTTVVTSLVSSAVIIWLTFRLLERMSSVPISMWRTGEFNDIVLGSVGALIAAAIVLSVLSMAVSIVVQAIVAAEVGGAVLAEKQTLRQIFARVRPVLWRVVGYSMLVLLVVAVAAALFMWLLMGLNNAATALAVIFLLAMIPTAIFFSIKIALVASVIVLEQARIGAAIRRSFSLTKGFFWKTLGIIFLVTLMFGIAGQVIAPAFGFIANQFTPVIAPTGDRTTDLMMQLVVNSIVPAAVSSIIVAIGSVVSSTATTLQYVNLRMIKEGLAIDLQNYVDDRDSGRAVPSNPYAYDPAHVPAMPSGYDAFGQAPFGQAPYGQAPYGQPTPPAPHGQSPYAPPTSAPGYTAPTSAPGYTPPASAPGYTPPGGYAAPTTPAAAPGYDAPTPFFPVDPTRNQPEDESR